MKKQMGILALFLTVLCAVVGSVYVLESRQGRNQQENFFPFSEDTVGSFQINQFTTGLLFKKDGDRWQVRRVGNELTKHLEEKAEAPVAEVDKEFTDADSAEVAKCLDYLLALKGLEPVATEPASQGTFEINEYSLHVIFFDPSGKELDRLYIGKHGPDPMTSFIKKKDSNNVYLADQNFLALLVRNYEDWLGQKEDHDKKKP